MIQLRFVVMDDGNGRDVRHLEMRHCWAVDASGAICPGRWSDWQRVPEMTLIESLEADEAERSGSASG